MRIDPRGVIGGRVLFKCPICGGLSDPALELVAPDECGGVWCDGLTQAPHHDPAMMVQVVGSGDAPTTDAARSGDFRGTPPPVGRERGIASGG